MWPFRKSARNLRKAKAAQDLENAYGDADPAKKLKALLDWTLSDEGNREHNIRIASWALHIAVLVFGGLTTVLLGLQIVDNQYTIWSRNVALIFSALSTLATGLIAFWNIDRYWIRRKLMITELRILRERLIYTVVKDSSASEKDIERINGMFNEYTEILEKDIEYWREAYAGAHREEGKPRGGNGQEEHTPE
jgi:hypothetical protein